MTTEILGLDEIVASQAQKEVPHNTALRQIEGWVRALSITTTAPPATPAAGASYIVPAGATGVWVGQDNKLAHYYGGSWKFRAPPKGVRTYVLDEDLEYVFNNAGAWVANGVDTSGFLTQAAADASYEAIGAAAAAVAAHAGAADPHSQYLTQAEAGALYDAANAASAAMSAHLAAGDPHPDYLTQAEGDARYAGTAAVTGGTVTSVALTTPGLLFDVGGSPVTGAGTLAMTLKTQAANKVLAGPATGADAAPTMRALVASDLPAQPFDLTAFYPGVPGASAIVTRVPVARAVTFPSGLTGSIAKASVAATASTVFDVQKNGSSVGSITFAATASSATFTAASAITLAAGDLLSIVGPATPDTTLANIGFVLAGTR